MADTLIIIAMVEYMSVKDTPTLFLLRNVYRLFGIEGFLEKIAVSGLPMKPCKDFLTLIIKSIISSIMIG